MNKLIKLVAASGLVIASTLPAFSEAHMIDPMTLTCADFSAMDKTGMMTTTQQMDAMMAMTEEEKTAAMAMTAEEKTAKMAQMDTAMAAMTDEEKTAATAASETSMTKMMDACKTMPEGTVADAAKAAK